MAGGSAPSLFNWEAPLVGLIGATIVAIANYYVQRWRYTIDRLGKSLEYLCAQVDEAADYATTYWVLDKRDESQAADAVKLEAILIGRQSRIQELVIALADQDEGLRLGDAGDRLVDLFDAMTGGTFRDGARPADRGTAQRVQTRAAELTGTLRRALNARARQRWRRRRP